MKDAPASYSFGPFELDPVQRLLLRRGKPVPLAPVRVFGTGPAARSPSRSRAGLPDSRLQPSGRSFSNHLRKLRLARARHPSAGRTKITSPFGELGASPLSSRLATPHRPNRVRQPTDWPFTSCCSPPRVTTTQLQSVTSYVDLERTFTSPTKCALRRTSAGVSPACPRRRVVPSISFTAFPEVKTPFLRGRRPSPAGRGETPALQGRPGV